MTLPEHDAGIYIHVPFCSQICPFCAFTVFRNRPDVHERYTSSIITELTLFAEQQKPGKDIVSIYFGGGTPSLLSVKNIAKILDAIHKKYRVTDEAVVSFECNPENHDRQYLKDLKSTGIHRLSIGIQSFNDRVLKKLGRIHIAADNEKMIKHAKEAGFDNVNFDMIYGTPFQSESDMIDDAKQFLAYQPKHISAYALTIEPGTRFEKIDAYGDWINQNDFAVSRSFTMLVELFQSAGINIYEVSNFAETAYESLQNIIYWQDRDYYGFGPGAHSKISATRKANTGNFRLWAKNLSQNISPQAQEDILDETKKRDEFFLTTLRTIWGVQFQRMESELSLSAEIFLGLNTVKALLHKKMATADANAFRLYPPSFMLANKITLEIVCELEKSVS